MRVLIESIMKYARETAATENAKGLLAVGFDYIIEKSSVTLFRQPKRFNG